VARARVKALRRIIGAAALGCGIFFSAGAFPKDPLDEPGPLAPHVLERLLLVDAERFGNRIVAVGDRGYIVISDDFGKSWRRARSPPEPLLTALDFLDDRSAIAVGHDAAILVTNDGGESWTQAFSAPQDGRPLLDVMYVKKDFAVAVGAYAAYYESTDAGKTWTARKIINDDKHFNAIVELGEGRLVILGEAGTILASSDWGKTWAPVPSPYKGSFFGGVVAGDGALIAFGMRGRIYRSKDKGASWTAVDNASNATLMGGEKLPDGSIVLAGAQGTALVSRDNGASFVPIQTGTTRALSKPIQGEDGTVLLLGEGGSRAARVASRRPSE
jgi:photosystem II stability/assembly factor-like uncharacterized protein